MIVTKKWIHAHRTPAGAWNRKQIEALGLSWPARKGWIKALEGTEISLKNALEFAGYRALKKPTEPSYADLLKSVKILQNRVIELEALLIARGK